jgi:hypothetical protein
MNRAYFRYNNALVIHNTRMKDFIKSSYNLGEVTQLFHFLLKKGTFNFVKLKNGLFPAAYLNDANIYTNYNKVWVRDNIFISYAHYMNGDEMQAVETIRAIGDFLYKYRHRFEAIINKEANHKIPMHRPHIRFNGEDLKEIDESWPHAQNDALGYYLWLLCKLVLDNKYTFRKEESILFTLLILYFKRITFWKDEDSGHWEEKRKVAASSIGVVTRALYEAGLVLRKLSIHHFFYKDNIVDDYLIEELKRKGKDALRSILPWECKQRTDNRKRMADAALLFLIYPLHIPGDILNDESNEEKILHNISDHLVGSYGIKRYIGDSFWTADTKEKQRQSDITADFSERMEERDKMHNIGEEAQWCIFDSIISVIYAERYMKSRSQKDLNEQIFFFNRSLAQLTEENCIYGAFKCPELYYLEKGRYVVNDTVPLLWGQANLWLAFKYMMDSLRK